MRSNRLENVSGGCHCRRIGTAGGTGYAIEFGGSTIRSLSMEGRMTVCNMAIEAGARAGLVAVDQKTIDYVKGRPLSPKGLEWEQAVAYWNTLHSDADAKFDTVVELDAAKIIPQVTWGTSPEMVLGIDSRVPDPDKEKDPSKRGAIDQAFKRRFTYDVYFTVPSPDLRAELWRRALPKDRVGKIDYDELAESFELTGGTWTYSLNNAHAAVQGLDAGETLSDSITFTASDGSTQTHDAKNIIIASGSEARMLPGLEPDPQFILTNIEILNLTTVPKTMGIIGAGAVVTAGTLIPPRSLVLGVPAKVERVEYDPNRSAHIALLCYADGERSYVIAPRGVAEGDVLQSGVDSPIKPGNVLPLRNIPVGSTIHCMAGDATGIIAAATVTM